MIPTQTRGCSRPEPCVLGRTGFLARASFTASASFRHGVLEKGEEQMTQTLEEMVAARLGIMPPVGAAGLYRTTLRSGAQIWVSGQLSLADDGSVLTGRCGADLDVETGRVAARQALRGVLSQVVNVAKGTPATSVRCLKLGVFIAATPEFSQQTQVADGASELLADVLGEAALGTRTAVGVTSLPRGAAVEIEAVFELMDPPIERARAIHAQRS